MRPDASLSVALVLLLSVTARNVRSISTLGWLLPLASVAADATWLVFLGPRLPAFAGLLPESLAPYRGEQEEAAVPSAAARASASADGIDGDGDGGESGSVRDQLALAYVAAAAIVKLLVMLPYSPLLAA